MYVESVQCTVLEVKVVEGLGHTVDVVLVNGTLKEGDTIVVSTMEGPVVTSIRALLTPPPNREMRVKSEYIHHETLSGAIGIKVRLPSPCSHSLQPLSSSPHGLRYCRVVLSADRGAGYRASHRRHVVAGGAGGGRRGGREGRRAVRPVEGACTHTDGLGRDRLKRRNGGGLGRTKAVKMADPARRC